MGGHVIFSHYAYFDELLNAAVGSGEEHWNTLQRVSYVWMKGRWIAYPFQNNIAALPDNDKVRATARPFSLCCHVLLEACRLAHCATAVKSHTHRQCTAPGITVDLDTDRFAGREGVMCVVSASRARCRCAHWQAS